MAKFTALHAPAIFLAATLLVPSAAAAQGMEVRRPYRGLFGGDPSDKTASSFSIDAMGAYDDNVYGVGDGSPQVGPQASGFFSSLSATLTLQRAGEKVSAGFSGTSDIRYYESDAFWAVAHHVYGFGRYKVADRTTLRTSGGVSYAPLYTPLFLMAPISESISIDDAENLTPPAVGNRWTGDYAVVERPSFAWQGTFDVSQAISSRTSLGAHYTARFINYVDEDELQRFDSIGVSFGHQLTRYATLRLGYGLNSYRLENETPSSRYHNIIVGVDYSRPISLSRRTRLTVSPGFALIDEGGSRQAQFAGSVGLYHEMGRTWTARAFYDRDVRFVEGSDAQVMANTARAGIQGLLNRRLQFVTEAQLVLSDQNTQARDYRAIATSARLNYALSRQWATYVQYVYYNYELGEALQLPGTDSHRTNRQGIRVGVTVWTPIFR